MDAPSSFFPQRVRSGQDLQGAAMIGNYKWGISTDGITYSLQRGSEKLPKTQGKERNPETIMRVPTKYDYRQSLAREAAIK